MFFVNKIKKLLESKTPTFGSVVSINQSGSVNVATIYGMKTYTPTTAVAVGEPVIISGEITVSSARTEKTIWLP